MVYGLDISKYRKSKDDSASNLIFNENEFEILKILYSNIDKFPLKITEQKFYDEEIRQRARDENPVAFVSYITEIARVVDEIQNENLKVHIYVSKIYDEIVKLRPEWHSDDDYKGAIKVVMTGQSSDPENFQRHIGPKSRRELLERRMKDETDELKLVIVRDMWLTGFDVPSLHTMYVDKPIKGHNLMQAI